MWGPWKGGGNGGFGPYGPCGKGTVFGLWTGGGEGGEGGEGGGGGGGRKKNRGGNYSGDIDGLNEALLEAFETAGVTKEGEDLEELMKKITSCAKKQSSKFYNDERASQKMTASQSKAFVEEFVTAVMGSLQNFLYDKTWFDKVAWNGALLMIVFHTFSNGKIFTRTLKTEIMQFVDDGVLAWSEDERIGKQMWAAVEASGLQDSQQKNANKHLAKSYDEAHFNAPFGTTADASLGPDVGNLQDFVKGWMSTFVQKGWSVFENGLEDSSEASRVSCVTTIFQTLLDPDNACLPVSLQPSLPAAPWAYIEQCATEVFSEHGAAN